MTAVLKRSYFFGNGCCFILEGLGGYKKKEYILQPNFIPLVSFVLRKGNV